MRSYNQMGWVHRRIRQFLKAVNLSLIRTSRDAVRVSLANQPEKTQSFGSTFEMPTILVKGGWKWQVMVTAALVTEDGKPHPHRLEGPHCKQGVFVYQTGQEDPFKLLKHK